MLISSFVVACFIVLTQFPSFEAVLLLAIFGFLIMLYFRMEPTTSEAIEGLSDWLPKWESENIKLSEIENIEDEKIKENGTILELKKSQL